MNFGERRKGGKAEGRKGGKLVFFGKKGGFWVEIPIPNRNAVGWRSRRQPPGYLINFPSSWVYCIRPLTDGISFKTLFLYFSSVLVLSGVEVLAIHC